MRIPGSCTALVAYLAIAQPLAAFAQIDQQLAQQSFKDAHAICDRDDGRLWGVSICHPMVIADARTQTFATSQQPPDAPRPKIIGLLNGPIEWGGTMWAAMTWDTLSTRTPRERSRSARRRRNRDCPARSPLPQTGQPGQ